MWIRVMICSVLKQGSLMSYQRTFLRSLSRLQTLDARSLDIFMESVQETILEWKKFDLLWWYLRLELIRVIRFLIKHPKMSILTIWRFWELFILNLMNSMCCLLMMPACYLSWSQVTKDGTYSHLLCLQ